MSFRICFLRAGTCWLRQWQRLFVEKTWKSLDKWRMLTTGGKWHRKNKIKTFQVLSYLSSGGNESRKEKTDADATSSQGCRKKTLRNESCPRKLKSGDREFVKIRRFLFVFLSTRSDSLNNKRRTDFNWNENKINSQGQQKIKWRHHLVSSSFYSTC